MEPQEVLASLEASGLRGRGGAGFAMGKKISFLPKGSDRALPGVQRRRVRARDLQGPRTAREEPPHADRGDRDRLLRGRREPLVHLHPRASTSSPRGALEQALAEAREAGYIGEDILGSGHSLSLVLHRGAGAYICGEETALLDSLEGKRGNPRLKPPFPANQGLYQGPTLINNVETLATVPTIVRLGGEQYATIGVQNSTGTKLVSVSGHVQRPGNYEIELGIPSRELIYDLAGGPAGRAGGQVLVPGRVLLAGADRRTTSTSPTTSTRWPKPARCSAPAR